MELHKGTPAVHAESAAAWRTWLSEHHGTEKAVWLIIYHKESGVPSVYYPEAVDEALCFGWIDSTPNKRDERSYYVFFAKRNAKSNWSGVNKAKVERLLAEGKMAKAGLEMIAMAKSTGTWTALDGVERLEVPGDLQEAFDANATAFAHWQNFAPSSRRGILEWILNAKKPETRAKRIHETVALAEDNIKANHPRQ